MINFQIDENNIVISVVSFEHPDYLYSINCTYDCIGMKYNAELDTFEEATKTFDEELQEINEAHDIKVDALVNEYNRAMTFDGSSETEKVEAIRAELNAAKSQYEIDVEQLAIKHYG